MPSLSPAPLRLSLLKPPLNNSLTPKLIKLTESGVVDDAYRAASGGIQGDGRLGDQSTGIWPAATNLNDNGNATTNTTGVTDHSSTTTRATSGVVKFGTTAFNVVSGNAAANEGPSQPINGGLGSTLYTVSAWVWLISGAATVRATLSDTVAGKQGGTAVVLTATPQKVFVTATTGIAGITETSYIETTVQQAGTWRIGGWQVIAAANDQPYIQTDGGDASRAASLVQVPFSGLVDPTQGWVMAAFRRSHLSTLNNGTECLWECDDGTNNNKLQLFNVAGGSVMASRKAAGGVTGSSSTPTLSAFSKDDITFVGYQWTASGHSVVGTGSMSLSANLVANINIPLISRTLMNIGSQFDSTAQLSGDILWFALGYKGIANQTAMTNAEASWGRINQPKPTLKGLKQIAPGRVGFWDGRTNQMVVG